MKKIFVVLIVSMVSFSAFSQTLNDSVSFKAYYSDLISKSAKANQGSVSISQDSSLLRLLNKHIFINQNDINLTGWRIQIYNSSGKEAREEANEIRNKFMNSYFDTKAYLIYQPPFFKIRVGDFRTKQEAFALYKTLLTVYPLSYLVQDKINLPQMP
jgi:hypothetical protein